MGDRPPITNATSKHKIKASLDFIIFDPLLDLNNVVSLSDYSNLNLLLRPEQHQGATGQNQETAGDRHIRDLMFFRGFQSDRSDFSMLLSGISNAAQEQHCHAQYQNRQSHTKSIHRVSPYRPGKESGGG